MIPVYLYNPSGELIQRLQLQSAEFNRNISQIGTASVICEIPKEYGVDYRIFVDHPGETNTLWLITGWEEILVGDKRLIQFSAQDGKRMYTKRIVWAYNDTARGYKINYPQIVAQELVNEQMVNHIDTYRNVIGLHASDIDTSLAASWTAWEGEVAWKPLWDVFTTLMDYGRATDNPFSIDFLVSTQGGTEFTPFIGRRLGISREVSTLQLSRFGVSLREIYNADTEVKRMFALGSGDGSLALYSYYSGFSTYSRETNPFFYKEGIVTLGNEDDLTALDIAAQSNYKEAQATKKLVIEGAGPVDGFWGVVIGYQDELTITHRDETYVMTVIGYSLSWEGAGSPSVSFVCAEGY